MRNRLLKYTITITVLTQNLPDENYRAILQGMKYGII